MKISPNNSKLSYTGRIDWSNLEKPVFVFPCTSVGMHFKGKTLKVCLKNYNAYWNNYLGCIIDGKQSALLLPEEGTVSLNIKLESSKNNEHEILVFKRQDSCHEITFLGFEIDDDGQLLDMPAKPARKIEVYGDSVSAGEVSEAVKYVGMEDPEHNGEYSNSWYSYSWITARKLNAQIHDIAQGGIALMDKTGYFNEPKQIGMETAWDKIRYNPVLTKPVEWNFSEYIPQVVIVAIGQNDSYPDDYMKENYNGEKALTWKKHYKNFICRIREKYEHAYIICCTTLLNHDKNWDNAIDEIVHELNNSDKKISHYLFKRNGCGTPGHLRIQEAEEMAQELCTYINSLEIENW